MTSTIEYRDPAGIEGDPYDVGHASAIEFARLLNVVSSIADSVERQVRNAQMTVACGLPADSSGERPDPHGFWEGSPEASLLTRARGALNVAWRLATELETTMADPLSIARDRAAARLRAEPDAFRTL